MNTTYQTLIVKFSEPITALDGIFNDAQAWGTDTLKGWIDDYESTRFTATNIISDDSALFIGWSCQRNQRIITRNIMFYLILHFKQFPF